MDSQLFNGAKSGYTLKVPTNWNTYESEYTTLKGGKISRVLLTQITDLVSRPTKYFLMSVGTPEAIFGVNNKVIQRVNNDQLVDFYIDQMVNSSVDYRVANTRTVGSGADKIYVIDASYAVPGNRFITKVYFQFKNGKTYLWSLTYRDSFANYAPTLQSVADSVQIRAL